MYNETPISQIFLHQLETTKPDGFYNEADTKISDNEKIIKEALKNTDALSNYVALTDAFYDYSAVYGEAMYKIGLKFGFKLALEIFDLLK